MGRKFKNSDDSNYYSEKSIDQKLEKLRYELIPNYSGRKNNNKFNKNKKTQYKKLFQK